MRSTRKVVAALAATATAGAVVGLAAPATADTTFTRTIVDPALTGAAFSQTGNVLGDVRPEIVTTGYGTYTVVAGVPQLNPGTMSVYTNAGKNKQGGSIDSWTKLPVFDES